MNLQQFDPTSPQFNADPYEAYKAFLDQKQPVALIGKPYDAHWVFSRELVAEVCENKKVFLKPGKDRSGAGMRPFSVAVQFGDGLFFMDPPRHSDVRAIMNGVFEAAIVNAREVAQQVANGLLDKALAAGALEVITGYAGPLAMQVFFQVMGVPPGGGTEWLVVDRWIRAALESHDKGLQGLQRLPGASATMAMRSYFLALGREVSAADKAASSTTATSIMAGMQRHTGTPASAERLNEDEATNTAVHMALGGYLSTEFLIGSGILNLLGDPAQWQLLRGGQATVTQAVNEMLRFDAPFQMADRWVKDDTMLGGVKLPGGRMFTLVYGSANRDPAHYKNPDRFDITRDAALPHFGFGEGIHRCIGEPLARTVAAVAIEALLQRCPTARIGEVGPWGADPYFRSLKKLVLLLR